MLKRGERICPCCGKKLLFEAPNCANAPEIIRTNGSRPYYATAGKFPTRGTKSRLFKYTSRDHRYYFPIPRPDPEAPDDINFEHGVYIAKAKRVLECDRIFNTNLVMFCQNCHANIAVNRNPCRLLRYYWIYPMTFACAGAIVSPYWKDGLFFTAAGLLIVLGMLAVSFVYYFMIRRSYSNFVVIDDCDRLVRQRDDLKLCLSDNNGTYGKNIFAESNILSTAVDGVIFQLYINDTGDQKITVHICGIDGEPERLLALIREKRERGETVTLPLTFEGKPVGTAKVTEIYDNKDRGL